MFDTSTRPRQPCFRALAARRAYASARRTCARRNHIDRDLHTLVGRACARRDNALDVSVLDATTRSVRSLARCARRATTLQHTTTRRLRNALRPRGAQRLRGARRLTSTCARRDHVIRTPRVVVAQRAHARARRACARVDHVTHAHLRTCASQSRDARRTTALRRTTASWRSTASRCVTLDPALGATTSAALCALAVQRARAHARVDHVIHAHLRTCASQSRDARRTSALRRATAS